jgi:anti-anti-sigma factor
MEETVFRHLSSETSDGVLVLTLTDTQVRGDELADELRDELLAALAAADGSGVVLDFRNVTFLSSVAFRPLLRLHNEVKKKGGRVAVCHLSPAVAEVMHLTQVVSSRGSYHAPLEEQPDRAAAVASLRQ